MIQLSIIIPHYNSPETLEVLLQSIPDIPEIEVLVIDDNSNLKLNVYSRCKRKFAEHNISFYENAIESKGAGGARNIGLQYASGKWLLFADADDYFVENFWSKIQRYLNDESEIIYFSPVSVKLGTSVASDRHEYYMNLVKEYCKKGDHESELKLRYTYWSPCSKMIRKELVDDNCIRFDGTLHSNDMLFSTKVGFYAKKIKAVDEVIYCITESEDSLTSQKDEKALAIRKMVFASYYFFMQRRLSTRDMKILGYGIKDFIYFTIYMIRMKFGNKGIA